MALSDLISAYGPINPGKKGTGTILGANVSPAENAQLGNPIADASVFNSLEDASHASLHGPFNAQGKKGTGTIPDQLGNIPPEIEF
jgi:hypothetical protein